MRPWNTVVLAATFAGCMEGSSGTFVGNPSLTAGYTSTDTERARGGELSTQEVVLQGCEGTEDVALEQPNFRFIGSASPDSVQIPAGSYCRVSLQVEELVVRFEDVDNRTITVIGREFEMEINGRFEVQDAQRWSMQLGPADWLSLLADVSRPGENLIENDDSALGLVFFNGLRGGTSLLQVEPNDGESLSGTVNFEDFSASPRGVPTTATGCEADAEIELAVPIPPAAMATKSDATEIGWCEGLVRFSSDLAPQETRQINYATLGTEQVSYNGWGQGCGSLHCNDMFDSEEQISEQACTVLAVCESDGTARVTGFAW
ncbi:MAG: hypothetical protein AB8H79_10355 [Myxococcota bacterium]